MARKKVTMKLDNDMTFEEGFKAFLDNCKAKNLRPHTILYYQNVVTVWYKVHQPDMKLEKLCSDTVNEFVNYCSNAGQKHTTINTNLRGIRVILYYFMNLEWTGKFKINLIKSDKEMIETYTKEDLAKLLAKPETKNCTFNEFRNWTVANFLIGTGCRVQTLINIKISDIDFENELINYSHTKNRKVQVVPLASTLKKVLMEYLRYRKGSADDYLFVNAYGGQLTANILGQGMFRFHKQLGVNKTGLHRYRHTFAKMWILNGGDIFRLQKILGHSDLDIVKQYVNMFTNDLKLGYSEFNPLEQVASQRTQMKMRDGAK